MKKIETRSNGTKRVFTVNDEVSRTDQSFDKDVNVNYIMAKYLKTGQIDHLTKNRGIYADVSQITDLLTATEQVKKANHAFNSLPAEIRKRFGNSPVSMVEFLQDPKNDTEAIKLGLKSRKTGLDKIETETSDSALETTPTPTPPTSQKTKKTDITTTN